MPPRHAYWTILVDGQPTAFRAAMEEDLLPTFNRLQQKHSSAEMKWFQNGKLWASRLEAQEAMHERGERGRMGDTRQGGGFRDRKFGAKGRESRRSPRPPNEGGRERHEGPEWKPKGFAAEGGNPDEKPKLDWKPKGAFTPAPKRSDRGDRPDWKSKSSASRDRKPDWKNKGFDRERTPEWKPKRTEFNRTKPGTRNRQPGGSKLDWTPKSGHTGAKPAGASPEKRKWIPKAEYKKSQGIEARRDKNWRPGGEHKDPRQKYKDAKKAKWTKFKANVRQRWEKKQGAPARRSPKAEGGRLPDKKRRDEE